MGTPTANQTISNSIYHGKSKYVYVDIKMTVIFRYNIIFCFNFRANQTTLDENARFDRTAIIGTMQKNNYSFTKLS